MNSRLWIPVAFIFGVFALIALRLGQLQLALHSSLKEKTKKEVVHTVRKKPLRGKIMDRSGRALAVTVERPSVALRPREVRVSRTLLASRLSYVLSGVSASEILSKLKGPSKFVWIKRRVSRQEGEKVEALNLDGVALEYESKRLYPYPGLAAGILGGVSIDGEGTGGIEHGLNPLLQGEDVMRVVMRDALGKVFAEQLPGRWLRGSSKQAGPFDVQLTLDAPLQILTERRLEAAVEAHEPRLAMVVVQEAATGAILASAVKMNARRPAGIAGFDPNAAASYTFEPGSTMKPLMMAAALEADVLDESEKIDCENGNYSIGAGRVIRDHDPYGILTVPEVLAYSSNVGMTKISQRLSSQQIFSVYRALGFGTKTTLPLTGEAVGILHTPESWNEHTPAMLSFGYEIGATALQMTGAYAALANGGVLLEPQIVSRVTVPMSGKILYQSKPRPIRQAVSSRTARRVLSMMEDVVRLGTGVKAQIPGYAVAGKTGTAQKLDPKTNKHSPYQLMVSFCGVFPMPKPQYAICTFVDEPTKPKVAWASDIAAPLFTAVAKDVINVFSIVPQLAESSAPKIPAR